MSFVRHRIRRPPASPSAPTSPEVLRTSPDMPAAYWRPRSIPCLKRNRSDPCPTVICIRPLYGAATVPVVTAARSHEIVGNRMFPATLAIDDPGVADELALPTVAISKTGDVPPVKQLDISGEVFQADYRGLRDLILAHLVAPLCAGRPNHERRPWIPEPRDDVQIPVCSKLTSTSSSCRSALEIEWGGSGAQDVGAERFTVYTPTLYFGKGFGDLPASLNWARPFAITGQVGYAIPAYRNATTASIDPDTGEQNIDTEFNPRVLDLGRRHSNTACPISKSAVVDLGLPDFFNHLIPLVEASMQTPVANTLSSGTVTTGTINSRLYLRRQHVPDRRRSDDPGQSPKRHQRRCHARGQLHFFLDDIFPIRSDGRSSAMASPQGGLRSADSDETFIQNRHRPSRHPASHRGTGARLP